MRKLLVVLAVMAGAFVFPPGANGGPIGCEWRHFFYDGNPTRYETTMLAEHVVPAGREWRITNISLLVEKHHGGTANAGEFTAVMDGFDGDQRLIVGQSTTPQDDGIGLQGQGRVNVGLESGTQLRFFVWLRPYKVIGNEQVPTDPANYYFTLGATVRDCHA